MAGERGVKFIEGGVALQKPVGSIFDPRTVGDGDIIAATRQITNPSGLTQFQMTLPSGREVESEWLREEQLKRALLPWIETIKAELQTDADEVRAKARRESEARKAAAPVLVSSSGDALTVEPRPAERLTARTTRSTTPVVPTSVEKTAVLADPAAFAKESLAQAKVEAADAEDMVQEAIARLAETKDNVVRWEKIVAALGPKESNEQISTNDTSSRGARRGRPAGSRNKPKQSADTAGATAEADPS